jgi:multicomponent Na+:H+ antiporter subunit E
MRMLRAAVLFVLLLGFWQALSGRLDPLFIGMGIVFSALVTWFGLRLLDDVLPPTPRAERVDVLQLLLYSVWLLSRIPPAGIAIARVVLDPRHPPRPGVVRFRTQLRSPAARTLLANSITLVPGTITLNLEGDELTVHAFTPDTVLDLATAATQCRIARVFREPEEQPPTLVWEPVHDELPEEPR